MYQIKQTAEEVKLHPANVGRNFNFNGCISEEVLRNYLSRSIVLSFLESGAIENFPDLTEECIQTILYTGAKYIARASCAWIPNGKEKEMYPHIKETIEKTHAMDPEVIFEACIFETAYPCFGDFEIPEFVFTAFGLPYEKRGFSYESMFFPDKRYLDHWEKHGSVPDMTQVETQMFFYFRGCLYIDLGFEALHYGQVLLIGETDTDYECWIKVMDMIRAYAKQHAARGFVLLNAHTHGIIDKTGTLLFDFHCYPCRPVALESEPPHIATERIPQRTELISGWGNSIYNRSMGGKTHSGWSCDSLPYFVEIDNYGCQPPELLNTHVDYYPWGYDEASWFASQPKWYRNEWLRYAMKWLRDNDSCGYIEMLGIRPISYYNPQSPGSLTKGDLYYINDSRVDDAQMVRDIWISDNQR